ncbi:MAG TPA: DUF3108 domain-containing protein [Hellea balneolensis]|uniref:DUF3108 domain-containing protein n=1 Tax=Hellea balneolensis TaxID=287478 RepID=A0A7C5R198_9PROT|nr:DUF3108 domain-containing protein [Hellea balneolensis]
MTNLLIKSLLVGAGLALAPMSAYGANTTQDPEITDVKIKLKGYVFGIKVIKADYQTQIGAHRYTVFSNLRTSGLGALLKKFNIWSLTRGHFDGADLKPETHLQQNMDKKHRRVEMRYGENAVDIDINPRLGSQGKPPASPEQRFQADDTLSAILNIMMRGYQTDDEICSGVVPVFDSKQHYNLRLKRAGTRKIKQRGYKGETIKCLAYYEPVSGFDPEDLPSQEEQSTPVILYLAQFPEYKFSIPVRMTYKISGFKAVIKVRDIQINKRPAAKFVDFGDDFKTQETNLYARNMIAVKK